MKKKPVQSPRSRVNIFDFSAWNFIIFLTLTFVLIVIVALTMSDQAQILRAKAGLACPEISDLPRPEDCPGGTWEYTRDQNGCRMFYCPHSGM